MLVVLLVSLALQAPPSPSCPDVAACRAAAEAAAARGEFETFHDLAWRAAQKGRPNDPALMFLLARAQALSGRPDDAIVMLGRLVDLHAPVDVTLPDFDRVRLRPGWPALESRLGLAPAEAPAAPGAPAAGPPPPSPAPTPRAADAPAAADAPDFDPPADLGPFPPGDDAVS